MSIQSSQSHRELMKMYKKISEMSVRIISEMINIDKPTVRQVLHENLNMNKDCAKIVPNMQTFKQNELQKTACSGLSLIHI